jgi:hydrogenase 3 maturation protease
LTAEIRSLLTVSPGEKILIITVGNSLRGDDGVGPLIAESLSSLTEGLYCVDAGDRPESVYDRAVASDATRIIIIDAAEFGAAVGEARIFTSDELPKTTLSTHTFPLSWLAALLEKDLGCRVQFLGIQAGTFGFQDLMTAEVRRTAAEIVKQLKNDLSS